MTIPEARSDAETAVVQLDEPAFLFPDNVSEGGDDSDGGYREQL